LLTKRARLQVIGNHTRLPDPCGFAAEMRLDQLEAYARYLGSGPPRCRLYR